MKVIPQTPCPTTLAAARRLLRLAEDGELIGLAFGACVRGRAYVTEVTGVLARDPTFGRGVVAALDDELSELVQSQANEAPTFKW